MSSPFRILALANVTTASPRSTLVLASVLKVCGSVFLDLGSTTLTSTLVPATAYCSLERLLMGQQCHTHGGNHDDRTHQCGKRFHFHDLTPMHDYTWTIEQRSRAVEASLRISVLRENGETPGRTGVRGLAGRSAERGRGEVGRARRSLTAIVVRWRHRYGRTIKSGMRSGGARTNPERDSCPLCVPTATGAGSGETCSDDAWASDASSMDGGSAATGPS